MGAEKGYYRHPTICGDEIAFLSEDDLWTVSRQGGVARRLTAGLGAAAFPSFSPSGDQIAFTGKEDGHPEVYLIDAQGGEARRLTWIGGLTQVVGWSPDGKEILFASDWRQPFRGYVHLHAVGAAGGPPRPMMHGPARAISFQPGGCGVVIGRNSGDPARWKRYRGGTAGTLWIDRNGTGDFAPLVKLAGNLANPIWIGDRVYFLSDHEGCGNLYSCTPTGRGMRRHTHHEDFYLRFPSSDGRRIVYQAGADLHIYEVENDQSRKLDVRIMSGRPQRQRKFVAASSYLEGFDLHPAGHSVACVSRGGVHAMGLWEGSVRRLDSAGIARHRLARWLPGGNMLVAVTDDGGEEAILLIAADGRTRPRRIEGDFGRPIDILPAPGGRERIALTNNRQEVLLVDLKTGKVRQIERSAHARIAGMAWSPDGRWLAYGFADTERTASIHLFDTGRGGSVRRITRSEFRDSMPSFDPVGKYLYFISDRIYDPVPDAHYFDLGFPRGSMPFLIPLKAETVSPFAASTRTPRAPGSLAEEHRPPKRGKSAPPVEVAIDLEGIENRIVPFPVQEGIYGRILGARGRALFSSFPLEGLLNQPWPETGAPPAKGKIEAYDFEHSKVELILDRVTDFSLSTDGKTLAIRSGNRIRVIPATQKPNSKADPEKPGRESGLIDLDRIRVAVVPTLEWRQMYREAWRLQRDQFWTPNMSGVDWVGVYERYLPLVDRVGCRSEFSDLLWEMQGELGTSHCYELGGDYRPEPEWYQGFLGADIDWDRREKTWKIRRILRGDSWGDLCASPLAAPGLRVHEGDTILEVGGAEVGEMIAPYERLVHCSGRDVELTLGRSPGRAAEGRTRTKTAHRKVTVKLLPHEFVLRYRDWVEANRGRVRDATRDRIGYLHIPDMGPRGFSEFHRAYAAEVGKAGLIVDVRWNGGGSVSQLLLEKLLRRRVGYDASRYGKPISYPYDAPMGPMVCITNEYAGSDGDIFSHCFKAFGLGPLIGKRTWGGVVGIWPRHLLVDGTVTTQPEFAFWFQDVGWAVENYGTDPDIEIEIRPQDHAAGADPQLERGIVEAMKLVRKLRPSIPALVNRPQLGFKRLPR